MSNQNISWQRKKWGSYPALSVIFNVTIALSIAGILGLLMLYANALSVALKENLEVKLYLKKDLSETECLRLREKIVLLPFVKQENGVPAVRFVSGLEAEAMITQKTGEDFKKVLDFQVLPSTYFIKIKDEFLLEEQIVPMKERLMLLEGVNEVALEETSLNEINENLAQMAWILTIFVVIFCLASIVLIDNAVRLALFSQRFLIRSMQLVGAEPNFIKKPYLKTAAINGLFSGFFACLLVFLVSAALEGVIDEMKLIEASFILLYLGMLFFGVLICTLSTFWAINKYLKKSLDDLY